MTVIKGEEGGSGLKKRSINPFTYSKDALSNLIGTKSVGELLELGGVLEVAKGLQISDINLGLKSDEAFSEDGLKVVSLPKEKFGSFEARKFWFGKNVLPEAPHKSLLTLIYEAYQDQTLIMLSVAALISLIMGLYEDSLKDPLSPEPKVGWVEGVAIQIAVLVVVLTNSINDYQKERQFRALNAKKEDRVVKVIRDGTPMEISVYELVVGDVLTLEPGDIVPVDGLYLSGYNLTCDESSATGESDLLHKGGLEDELDPFILSGSKVQAGVAKVLTVAVGESSFGGKTLMAMRESSPEGTPLQQQLTILADQISNLGLVAAGLMLIVLALQYWYEVYTGTIQPTSAETFSTMVQIVIQAITVVVVAVPEGLPMAVTLALAYATKQMLKDNNLVRILASCETMGNATVLCSDKTGTLTQNEMTVVQGVVTENVMTDLKHLEQFKQQIQTKDLELLLTAVACNSSAFEGKDEKGNLAFIGSKTESALLNFAKNLGQKSYQQVRDSYPAVKLYPFASEVKSMTTIVSYNASTYRQFTTGASEIVLAASTSYLAQDGTVKPLDSQAKEYFNSNISKLANEALRTIALAYRDVNEETLNSFDADKAPLDNLVLIGVVGIEDPLREGVVESIKTCKRAGVQVKMITGDNIETARAIALKAGILTKGGIAISGPEFRKLSDEERLKVVPRMQVLARSSPSDKQVVVRVLQSLGDVVGMTGDGTNDGPALKLADVGFSMGIAGTEVAKEASAIILMDDNFNSIVKALKWGRAVNSSVRKFLQFQLTVNITAVILAFVSAVFDPEHKSILTATQLLWVNLIMDTLAALALATEPPTNDLLLDSPASKKASLISGTMWKHIFGQSLFQVIVAQIIIKFGPTIFQTDSQAVINSAVFNTFVFLQIFNEFNCRRINDEFNIFANLLNNSMFIYVQIAVLVSQVVLIQFGGTAFSTFPLTIYQWAVTVGLGFLTLPIGAILRKLPTPSFLHSKKLDKHVPTVSYRQLELEAEKATKQ